MSTRNPVPATEIVWPEGVEVPDRIRRIVERTAATRTWGTSDARWDRIEVTCEPSYDRIVINRANDIEHIAVAHWWVKAERDQDSVFLTTSLHGLWSVPAKGRSAFCSGFRMVFGNGRKPSRRIRSERDFMAWAGI